MDSVLWDLERLEERIQVCDRKREGQSFIDHETWTHILQVYTNNFFSRPIDVCLCLLLINLTVCCFLILFTCFHCLLKSNRRISHMG